MTDKNSERATKDTMAIAVTLGHLVEIVYGPKCQYALVLSFNGNPDSIAVASDIMDSEALVAVLRAATESMKKQSSPKH